MIPRLIGFTGAWAAICCVALSFAPAALAAAPPPGPTTPDPQPPTISTVTPVVTVTPFPNDIVATNKPVFTFSVDVPATVTCKIDSGFAYTPCTSPSTSPIALPDGPHTLQVAADNGSGIGYGSIAFTVDTTPPDLTIIDPAPGSLLSDSTPVVNLAVNGGTATCSFDAAPMAPCDANFVSVQLANGPHRLCVRATDSVANTIEKCIDFAVDASDNTLFGPKPSLAAFSAGRGGKVVHGKFKVKLSLSITPKAGADLATACWGSAIFTIRPAGRGAKTARRTGDLKRSGAKCVAHATISLPGRYKGAGASALVSYPGSVAIGRFTRKLSLKHL